jgi:hypothetical protein
MRAADTTGHEPAERAEPAVPAELLRGEPAVRRWARAVRWYVRSMMGDDAYDRYRAASPLTATERTMAAAPR